MDNTVLDFEHTDFANDSAELLFRRCIVIGVYDDVIQVEGVNGIINEIPASCIKTIKAVSLDDTRDFHIERCNFNAAKQISKLVSLIKDQVDHMVTEDIRCISVDDILIRIVELITPE